MKVVVYAVQHRDRRVEWRISIEFATDLRYWREHGEQMRLIYIIEPLLAFGDAFRLYRQLAGSWSGAEIAAGALANPHTDVDSSGQYRADPRSILKQVYKSAKRLEREGVLRSQKAMDMQLRVLNQGQLYQ